MSVERPKWSCRHDETTEPDEKGYAICVRCFTAVRRPQTFDELIRRIKG